MVRTLSALVLTAFIGASLFGIVHSIGMQTQPNGKMTGCMFISNDLCSMTPLEHAVAWQNLFTSLPGETAALVLLAFLLSLAFSVPSLARSLFQIDFISLEPDINLYRKRLRTFSYLNPLQVAFARGILNSKAY